ncbi:MAG: bifunctional riboflavin kinase/FAD synthetase [Acidobacteriia bacterium]|nr:bifunctional riboflavin kinase/FAD synthetase [Terriglobia bacterium]
MRVYHSLGEAAGSFGPSVVSIGNFDGVHLGHQQLLRRVREMGARLDAKPSIITFDPHPTVVLAAEHAPKLLTTIEQRLGWMERHGVMQALVLPFTREFSLQSPEQFVERVLRQAAGVRGVLVGENFRFGNRQMGNTALLKEMGARDGFAVEVAGGVFLHNRMVSSTEIRRQVRAGHVALAARLLGRFYGLEGKVVQGRGVGSRQTMPTLNLDTTAEVLPACGVYVTRTTDLGTSRRWNSVTNVGVRPTFGGDGELSIESFVLSGYEPPPPERIRVEFLHRLREERRFADPAALKAQILKDAARAQTYLRRLAAIESE